MERITRGVGRAAKIDAGIVILLFDFEQFASSCFSLAFSTRAAYAASAILLAGNRQALRDRLALEHAASEADIEEEQLESNILDRLGDPLADRPLTRRRGSPARRLERRAGRSQRPVTERDVGSRA